MSESVGNVCTHCGKVVHPDRQRLCNHCGLPFRLPANPMQDFLDGALVVVRVYPGRTQADAAGAFQVEAVKVAELGYMPVAQSWADGRPGLGRVLALGLLASSMRPNGALTVTYQRQRIAEHDPAIQNSDAPGADTKDCPQCAETVRGAAKICRFCRHEFPEVADP